MKESVLRDFFLGAASAETLRLDLVGAVKQTSTDVSTQYVTAEVGDFAVRSEHLVRACDAVLSGELPADDLEKIGFCFVSSDYFHWDGDSPDGGRVAETAYDWSAPEINYPLTDDTVIKFRERLVTGRNLFTRSDVTR